MAKPVRITGPIERVVSKADLRTHLRIDDSVEDTLLGQLSDAAQAEAESYTWRKLLKQTWDQYYDGFTDPLLLRYPPLHSDGVTSVTYTDTAGDAQTLATSVYEAGEVDGITVVRRKFEQVWPSTRSHADVVIVRFVCGFDTVDDVPEPYKQAIRLHAGWYYRNREGEAPLPEGFYNLLRPLSVSRPQPIGAA